MAPAASSGEPRVRSTRPRSVSSRTRSSSIDVNTESAGDRPGIAMDEICDGNTRDCLNVTLDGARHLLAALIAQIDEVDGWASK